MSTKQMVSKEVQKNISGPSQWQYKIFHPGHPQNCYLIGKNLQTVCHLNKESIGITFKLKTVLFVLIMGMEYNGTVQDQTCIVGYVTSVLRWPALKTYEVRDRIPFRWEDQTCLLAAKDQKTTSPFPCWLDCND